MDEHPAQSAGVESTTPGGANNSEKARHLRTQNLMVLKFYRQASPRSEHILNRLEKNNNTDGTVASPVLLFLSESRAGSEWQRGQEEREGRSGCFFLKEK